MGRKKRGSSRREKEQVRDGLRSTGPESQNSGAREKSLFCLGGRFPLYLRRKVLAEGDVPSPALV